jgi:hypothetical protein
MMKRTKFPKKTSQTTSMVRKKVGRPTSYKKEYCQQIIDYFTNAPLYEEVTIPHYSKGELVYEDVKRFPPKLPTLVQFAKFIGVSYPTVYNWQCLGHASFHEEFLDAYYRAKHMQKDFLIQAGLSGVFNPGFATFVAINITDMQQKNSTELNTPTPLVQVTENNVGVNVVNIDAGEVTKAIIEACRLGLAPELLGSIVHGESPIALPAHSNT